MLKNTRRIKQIVEEMGGRFEEVIPERNCYYIHIKKRAFLITRNFRIVRNFISGADFTKFKDLTYTLLRRKSLPTPETAFFFKTVQYDLKKKLAKLKFPIIIKNASGSNSIGIFPYVNTINEAKKILEKNIPKFKSMVAQEMIFGKEYRLLVLDNKIIGALEMIKPKVFGDNKSTVLELIKEKQLNTKRKTEIDDILKHILKKQGVTLKTVLKKGTEIYIKGNSALDEGGETRDVTHLVNKKITILCVKASNAIGHYLTGLDVICDDISLDPSKQDFGILEMNGKPDVYIHYEPTYGQARDVVKEIITFVIKIGATKKSKNV
ncbi:MAG: hypothetical protein A2493_00965 [Candidatus Magasanikbacteria bacterium RIFOXYC12_FULL_33_11]|uniref:ATP-grasp domain-containing protein n=1 Tax=Candidatus Magasanikbacteria bacterium RIFOXYC12_FULL_33_11 TaxID=1798701 RepID=A0A1F6NP97_9BACT|nr:MAG: hypothetical protein A2493_00965 [Candidatus Magasanikbacteria bacterium RIFOXYC12_FULL_33_11]